MKKCPYCGRDNAVQAKNCFECGTEFKRVSQPNTSKAIESSESSISGLQARPLPPKSESDDRLILKYDNILISSRGMTEHHANKVIIFVPAVEIHRITLRYGRSDHRPILTISVGAVLVLVGIFGMIELCRAPSGFRYEIGMLAFGVVGGSLVFDALKLRFFFEVQKKKGVCRLVLSKHARKKDILEFCEKVISIYNYNITNAA